MGDGSNQSDCVAFLHAMAAKDETSGDANDAFVKHLTRCFKEYLFLVNNKKKDEAIFMLGIALHGIMDSFTPSHTGFQKYAEQDMACHAQGDVLPNGKLTFDPGQYSEESEAVQLLDKIKKGFDNDNQINAKEFKMLWIFLVISDVQSKKSGERYIVDKQGNIDFEKIKVFRKLFKGKTRSEINSLLLNYIYGPQANIYEIHALWAMISVYDILYEAKKAINSNYEVYFNNATNIIDNAIKKWKEIYNHMHMDKSFKCKHQYLNILFKDYTK